jgi:hypothetical protein
MEDKIMQINYNITGEQRKALVQAISEITGLPAVYISGDGRSYAIGDLTVNKDGVLDYSKHDGFIHLLVNALAEKGFPYEPQDGDNALIVEQATLSIEMPLEGFTEATLGNLERLVLSKAALIKKAIGAEALPIDRTETTLRFPWFSVDASQDEVQTYVIFIERLCTTAKERKRIMAVEREVENEKYAFRCFLLKQGFIGDEYKLARKKLLSRLEGDSAWRKKK